MGRRRGSKADRARSDRSREEGKDGLSPAAAWRWCALAGLATLAASLGFDRIPDLVSCGPPGRTGAILALELVRSPQDLLALFGGGAQPCAERLAAAQYRALTWDMAAFIPAYGAFLCLGAWALRPAGRRLALAAFAACLTAALLDQVEGVVQFRLVAAYGHPPALFDALFWAVRPKFALLGLGEILLALLLLRGGWCGKLAALVAAAGGVLSLWFLFADPHDPLMMAGHRYAWTALLVAALIASVRATLVVGPRNR